jgi:hypothetical protein
MCYSLIRDCEKEPRLWPGFSILRHTIALPAQPIQNLIFENKRCVFLYLEKSSTGDHRNSNRNLYLPVTDMESYIYERKTPYVTANKLVSHYSPPGPFSA